jgi:hypothetical protein
MSMWLGMPVLALGLVALKVPFRVPRRHWPELLWLAATNMFFWHAVHHPGHQVAVQRARGHPGLHHADLFGRDRRAGVFGGAVRAGAGWAWVRPPWVWPAAVA